MKLSARNILKGKVVTIIRGVTTHNVKIDIGQGIIITSSVTAVAIKDLKLKRGDDAYAIIKSSEVIIGKD